MTAPTPDLPNDALSAEERALAMQLTRLDGHVGPSAALDARILASAHAAVAPRPARRSQHWSRLVGSMAVVVATVGLAWQLTPMFDLPPPHGGAQEQAARDGHGRHESELLVEVAPPARRPPAPVASAPADAAAAAASPPTAPRRAPPSSAARIAAPPPETPTRPAARRAAVAPAAERAAAAVEVPVTPAPAPAAQADTFDRPTVTGACQRRPGPVPADYHLLPTDWLEHIRACRAAGDEAGARTSLRWFVLEHPHVEVPADLRDLLPR